MRTLAYWRMIFLLVAMRSWIAKKLVALGNWFIDSVPAIGFTVGDHIKYCRLTEPYWRNPEHWPAGQ